jgi:hypothetical protein
MLRTPSFATTSFLGRAVEQSSYSPGIIFSPQRKVTSRSCVGTITIFCPFARQYWPARSTAALVASVPPNTTEEAPRATPIL